MTRGQRRRKRAARVLVLGPGLILPGVAWHYLHEPYLYRGLAAMTAAGFALFPPLWVLLLFTCSSSGYALLPRRWRASYRHRHGRDGAKSAVIPEHLREIVLAADRYKCVYRRIWRRHRCDGPLEADHSCPWIQGGPAKLANLFTLCKYANDVKSGYWPGQPYHAFGVPGDIAMAAAILAAERRRRLNPFRLWRLAMLLPWDA